MSSHKRKRSASIASRASSQALPSDTLNPHSHSQSTIKQLHVAGLTENDFLPSTYIPHFPHRPIRPSHLTQSDLSDDDPRSHDNDDDDDDDDDERASTTTNTDTAPTSSSSNKAKDKARRAKGMRDAQDQHLGLLTNVILRALEEGDIARAKRAFGLVRRSEVRGKPVDLRRNGLWSMGAEVLMRDGEVKRMRSRSVLVGGGGGGRGDAAADKMSAEGGGAGVGKKEGEGREADEEEHAPSSSPPLAVRRWGVAANMPQLRAYLEGLNRQYPYNRLHPNSISDVDFYPVLFGCEFYNAWTEHRLALERLEQDAEAWSDDIDIPMEPPYADDDYNHDADQALHLTGRDRRLRQSKADVGLRAMATMRDVAKRMDTLMENAPYKTSVEMLRLRGMVALYVGDLSVPPPPRTDDEDYEGQKTRDEERDRAGRFFRKMKDHGGRVDAFTEKWLAGGHGEDSDADEEDDMQSTRSGLPMFSSLPTR